MPRLNVITALWLILLTACAPPTPTTRSPALETLQLENAALRRTATAAAQSFSSTLAVLERVTEERTPTRTPTSIPTATPNTTPTPRPAVLELISSTFILDYERIIVLTLVRNNNPFAVQMAPYQIGLYDQGDALVQAASGVIDLVLPQQQIMLSDVLITPRKVQYNPKYHTIERLEVLISEGIALQLDEDGLEDALEVSQTQYLRHDYFPRVTGIITSKIDQELRAIPVTAVVYDSEDAVIGGGMGYLTFLPALGSAAVDISVAVTRRGPGRGELLPRLSLGSVMDIHQGGD